MMRAAYSLPCVRGGRRFHCVDIVGGVFLELFLLLLLLVSLLFAGKHLQVGSLSLLGLNELRLRRDAAIDRIDLGNGRCGIQIRFKIR